MSLELRHDGEPQLSKYLAVLRRRWSVMAAIAVAVALAAASVTLVRGVRYTATAHVGLGGSPAQEAIRASNGTDVGAAARELSNEVNLAMSDAVTEEVVGQLGLEPDVTITAHDESDALRFAASAPSSEAAALHANTWAQAYVDVKRRQTIDSITEAVEVFQRDLAELRTERQELRQPLDALESQLAATTVAGEQRAVLQAQTDQLARDLSFDLNLIDTQIQAVAENITALELDSRLAATGTARIAQIAAPPQDASSGSLVRNLALATLAGLVLGAAAGLVVDNLDPTIKSTEDVAALGVPVLGGIPTPGRTVPEDQLALATMRHTGTPVAEAYQKVRTAVEFSLVGRQINSLLITSPNRSEGKTTLSVNLAWAMSAVDHRVALVDVDFRQPRVHEVFGCSARPGLSDSLLAEIPLPQLALRVDEHGSRNLIVIPTGTEPSGAADFVASPAFRSLIGRIERDADLVILDAPPVLPVSDALSIGRHVDAVVMVVKAGSTTRGQLAEALNELSSVGADVLGVCVVGLHHQAKRYGGYDDTRLPRERRPRRPRPFIDLDDDLGDGLSDLDAYRSPDAVEHEAGGDRLARPFPPSQ